MMYRANMSRQNTFSTTLQEEDISLPNDISSFGVLMMVAESAE